MAFDYLTPHSILLRYMGIERFLINAPQARFSEKKLAASPPPGSKTRNSFSARSHCVAEPAKSPPTSQVSQMTPVLQWPEIWKSRLKLTKKGKICWTYWKLADDLAGRGADGEERKQRGQFLRKMFGELGLPGGTHTFWPVWLPEEGQARADIFWAAIRELGCREVIILGSRAARELIKDTRLEPMGQHIAQGHLVWLLRDIDVLRTNGDYYRVSLTFLRTRLKGGSIENGLPQKGYADKK